MPISDDMPFSPSPDGNASPGSLFQAIVFDVLMRCNVCKPATVVAWAPPVPNQLPAVVTVQIDFMYARAIDNATDLRPGETLSVESAGLRAVGAWVPIPNVPVLAFGTSTFGHRGAVPIGTTGILIFADAILDQWKTSGGPVDPALYERHSLNCGIFIPTLYHGLNTPVVDPLVDVLGPNDDTAGFEIATGTDKSIRLFTTGPNATVDAATLVNVGALAVEAITKAESMIAAIDALLTAGVSFAGVAGDPSGENAGLAFAAAQAAWELLKNSIKATKGRVE
jgi:hypothetical protein